MIPKAGAEFVCDMEAVLDVYERPYDAAHPVVCIDESPRQLISESRPAETDKQGNRYEDYEYRRQGVVDMYMIAEPKAGKRDILVKPDHKSCQWASVLSYVAEELHPDAERISVVADNLSAHRAGLPFTKCLLLNAPALL